MTVSRKKHLWVVSILYSVIAILAVALVVIIVQNKVPLKSDMPIAEVKTSEPEEYLHSEEGIVIVPNSQDEAESIILPIEKVLFEYVEVKDSCGVHFAGECVVVRDGPSTEANVVTRLRNQVILKVNGLVVNEDRTWYKIIFDEHLLYPERVSGDWYIAAEYVNVLFDEGSKTVWEDGGSTTTKKHIIVDKAEQKLYAFDGDELFMETVISTGLELSPTPSGTFTVFKKTPSRYMQGPLPGFSDYYDLPGVPWNLYFTQGGAVIHGAYWHDSFGIRYSHGCVNLSPEDAKKLYSWAILGTKVIVK